MDITPPLEIRLAGYFTQRIADGVSIRQRSPYNTTCVCSLTNGRVGYFATAEAYDQGGYEPSNSWFPKGIAETLRDAAVELLNRE